MPKTLTVSEVARRLSRETGSTVAPHVISALFYKRQLDDDICPIVGRIRLIPEDYIPAIEGELRRHGFLAGASEPVDPGSELPD